MVTIVSTLGLGRAGAVCTALGVLYGQAVWTRVTSAGISALLVALPRTRGAHAIVESGLSLIALGCSASGRTRGLSPRSTDSHRSGPRLDADAEHTKRRGPLER